MRYDIQFLRGFAVLAVVLYHADVVPIAGGYLGVDIFFVISGYLITSIILRDLDRGTFSFVSFYIKRAKRLLPAAYSTFIFTTILCYAFLTGPQWDDYIKQLVGAITFTANLILPLQSGYFEPESEGKPLLHIWSLSVEEQYYLIIPLLIYLTPAKWRGMALLLCATVSLIACIIAISFPFTYWRIPELNSQTLGFFSLPTRAWELLAGSLLAWISSKKTISVPKTLKSASILLILYLTYFPADSAHPRGDALAVVLATTILLAGQDNWLQKNIITNTMAKVGDFSYSLYLIHWPLFALAHNAYLGNTPDDIKFGLIFISMGLAITQYHLVEQRFRYGWQANRNKTYYWLAASSVLVILLPLPAFVEQAKSNVLSDRNTPNTGLSVACSTGKVLENPEICTTSENPIFAVWGDSYAMHLIPGLIKDPRIGESVIQITKSACAPIIGVASIDAKYDEYWAAGCLKFNDDAISYLESQASIKYVVLSSPFSGYFNGGELKLFHFGKSIIGDRSIAINQFIATIEKLREIGKTPVVLSPPPVSNFNVGECWERVRSGLTIFGRADCNILAEEYQISQQGIINGLIEAQMRAKVDIVWLDKILCKSPICTTAIDDTSLYLDRGHLSVFGSEFVLSQLSMYDRILGVRGAASTPLAQVGNPLLPK